MITFGCLVSLIDLKNLIPGEREISFERTFCGVCHSTIARECGVDKTQQRANRKN